MSKSRSENTDAFTIPLDMEAYKAGLKAFREGISINDNPNPKGDSRTFWFTGWYEGSHEQRFGWKPRWE